jgi:hypothetical protein
MPAWSAEDNVGLGITRSTVVEAASGAKPVTRQSIHAATPSRMSTIKPTWPR